MPSTKPSLTFTKKQEEVLKAIADYKHIHLRGGSRSGKTYITVFHILSRASKTKSRHLIGRKHYNHVKSSIVLDTFPKVAEAMGIKYELRDNKSYAELSNGSQIWFHGFDDKERTEKILGNEYSSIFFNEISEMSYKVILLALTRLSENSGLMLRAYYDENPKLVGDWQYKAFIEQKNPIDESVPLLDKGSYISLKMNPTDNKENLTDDYLQMLSTFPEAWRKRFFEGEYQIDLTGVILSGLRTFSGKVKGIHFTVTDPKDTGTDYWCSIDCVLDGKNIYINDVIYTQANPDITVPGLAQLIKVFDININYIETNYGGSFLLNQVQDQTQKQIQAIKNQTNKLARIINESIFIKQHFLFRVDGSKEYNEFLNHLKYYTGDKAQPDDAPDAVAMASKVVQTLFYHNFH